MAKARDVKITSEFLLTEDYEPSCSRRKCFSPWQISAHLFAVLLVALTANVTLFHVQVIHILEPFSAIIRGLPAGFLIPGAITFVLSFPPLFGHEIIAILCGAEYGLYAGFAIIAVGTIVGEAATWLAVRRLFRGRVLRLQKTDLGCGSLAQIADEGGFLLVLLVRISVIPQHFSTAFFSTCNVRLWHVSVAALLTMPKQMALVYLGSLPVSSGIIRVGKYSTAPNTSRLSTSITFDTSVVVQLAVLGATSLVSIGLAVFFYLKTRRIHSLVLEEQHRRRLLLAVAPESTGTSGAGRRGGAGSGNELPSHYMASALNRRSSRHASLTSLDSNVSSCYSQDSSSNSNNNQEDAELGCGNSVKGLIVRGRLVTTTATATARKPATMLGSNHASLNDMSKIQQNSSKAQSDELGKQTRGRPRTRTTHGRRGVPAHTPPPPPAAAGAGAASEKEEKAAGKKEVSPYARSKKAKSSDLYKLYQPDHQLSTPRRDRNEDQDKDGDKTRKKSSICPKHGRNPPEAGSSSGRSSHEDRPGRPGAGGYDYDYDYDYVLPPLPPPPPLTSLLRGVANTSSTSINTASVSRPTSSSSMLSATSFSRPRPPRPQSSSRKRQQQQRQQQQQQHHHHHYHHSTGNHQRARTLSVSSTGAGHTYHSRFQSEDSTTTMMAMSNLLPLPALVVGEAISTPSEI
ncbi:VTT domain-containing protein [Microdochium nivale]|nr:VTT domain-containing protein [Microdochium nivale]